MARPVARARARTSAVEALARPARVFAPAAFAPLAERGVFSPPGTRGQPHGLHPPRCVTDSPGQSREARTPAATAGGACVAEKVKMAQGTGKWFDGENADDF